jgi:hypothetical protein
VLDEVRCHYSVNGAGYQFAQAPNIAYSRFESAGYSGFDERRVSIDSYRTETGALGGVEEEALTEPDVKDRASGRKHTGIEIG